MSCGRIRWSSWWRGGGWRERGPRAAREAPEAEISPGAAALDSEHRAREGQEHGFVRDHAPRLGPGLPRRRLPVREERQVERWRAEGCRRFGQHRLVQDGRRLDLDLEGPRRKRGQSARRLGGGQAASRRRDLRHAPPRRVHLPDEVRLGGYRGGGGGSEKPSRLPARHHHGPRRAAGTHRDRRPGKRGQEDKAPVRRGLSGAEGDRMVVIPRIVVAGTHSGVGKTTVACGLMAALAARGYRVASFKVGPDFIDPSYHSLATGRPGRNLDAFLSGPELIAPLFAHGARGADVAVIEGVMGLFDGKSGAGEYASTAHVA